MAADPTRLVVSFIGSADLRNLTPVGDELSPIRRVLRWLFSPDCSLDYVPPGRTRVLLFDDKPHDGERARFCDDLRGLLPGLGLSSLEIDLCPLHLPKGPTDLNALYELLWDAIPTRKPEAADETVFHLSSGTWAMSSTLLLAANCLRFEQVRLIETSREQGVCEVRPPYVLAARESRTAWPKVRSRLPDTARRKLLADTVVSEPVVAAAYTALFKAATNRKLPQRILVQGPVGSGKWHACRQFAVWRGADSAEWLEPDIAPSLPEGRTLLIRRLDAWPAPALQRLQRLSAERPDLAIVATFRTDLPPAVPLTTLVRDGLRGAVHVHLPALGARGDFVELGEALARRQGALAGKVNERLRDELLTDVYPHNLHDLETLLATAAAHSPGRHPERGAYLQARQIRDTQALLAEAWQILAGMDFGPDRHGLDEVMAVIRALVVRRALADGRSMESAGELLGVSQQTVSSINAKRLDLSRWRTRAEGADGAP